MSSSIGLLDFFVLEASDYVERLDGMLATGKPLAGADAEQFARQARALRGSATMARQGTLAELAGGVERAARALRDGQIPWDAAVRGVLVAAIDDLKILIRGVRAWGGAEEQRARTRIGELAQWAPKAHPAAVTPASASSAGFLAGETAEVAAALEAWAARPGDRGLLGQVLSRVRALRGVAAIKDVPPLADVMDAIERAAKPVELGRDASPLQQALLVAAAAVLRRATGELRAGGRPDPNAVEVRRFADAAAAAEDSLAEADAIVPVASLFGDAGGLVETAPNPPTSRAERFRLETVSQAEHLRRLVQDARSASDPATRERLARELRGALRALRRAAESFEEREVASFVAAFDDGVASLDALALTALDEAAMLLAEPSTDRHVLAARLQQLSRGRTLDDGIGAGFGATTATSPSGVPVTEQRLTEAMRANEAARRGTPSSVAAASASRPAAGAAAATRGVIPGRPVPTTSSPTPTGRELQALLQSSIVGLGGLETEPLSQPVPIVATDGLVPIEAMLYTGKSALERAREVRDEIRRTGGAPRPEQLEELFDLLDLVTAE